MDNQNYELTSVYGINRELPLNYVERHSADFTLKTNLERKQHLIIYGSSKQGKTSLRKHCINESDYIVVQCNNRMDISALNTSILKQADFRVELSTAKTETGKSKILASATAGIFGSNATASADYEKTGSRVFTDRGLELDPEDTNDIIQALKEVNFDKYIILEDFHYLEIPTQKDFAVELKAFYENSDLTFIIIGVWLEENRLSVYNGDLTGRLLSIDADKWSNEEMREVINQGEKLLNLRFAEEFKSYIINNCFDSIYIVQESCYQCCLKYNIQRTQEHKITIGSESDARKIVNEVVKLQSGRFNSFITQFANGFQDTELEMYKWLIYCIISTDITELSNGLKQSRIKKFLHEVHPRGAELNSGNLTQALQSIDSLQIKKNIKPIILDYDQANIKLNIVDKSFLIWLSRQNVKDLANDLLDIDS